MLPVLFQVPRKQSTSLLYLLRDLFTGGSVAAGTRTATVGSETITDSGGALSIDTTQQRLIVASGTNSWNDPVLSATLDAATFGAVAAIVRLTGASATGPALTLHSSATPDPTSAGMGLHFATPQISAAGGSASSAVSKSGTRVRSIDYMFVVVKRAGGGAIVGICGGIYGTFPSMTPLWIVDSDSIATSAYVALANKSGAWKASNFTTVKAALLPAALTTRYGAAAAADTFTRANGNLAGSSTEVGSLTWATPSGTPTITSNVVTTGSGEVRPYVTLTALAGIIEVTVNTAASGNIWAAVTFRFDSSNQNFLMFRLEKTQWKLEQRTGASGGTSTVLASSAFSTNNGQAYRLRVVDYSTVVRIYIDGAEQNPGGVATTFNNDKFGVGITRASSADNGSTFDNFAAWPSTITVPSELGPFTAPPVGSGAATITDAFTGTDSTALSTYNAAWSTFGSGSWEINTNKARMTAAATSGYAVRDTSLTDHEVSIDITLPAAPGGASPDWFIGAVARCTDSTHYIIARYLYQSNSPEIEIQEVNGGGGTLIGFVNLGAGNLAGSSTHTLRLAVKGQEVAAYQDGELVCQAYTSLTSGTKAGFGVDSNTTGQPTFDNYAIKAT